jgi:hypothetical protein
MERPPIQDAFERQLEELGQQHHAGRLEDFLRGAEREALQRHRRAVERRVPEEIWEQIEEHEGMDEGAHEVPRVNPPTRGRMERTEANFRGRTARRSHNRDLERLRELDQLIDVADPAQTARNDEEIRTRFQRSIAFALRFRRPEWSQRQVTREARRIAAEWNPNLSHEQRREWIDRMMRLEGY